MSDKKHYEAVASKSSPTGAPAEMDVSGKISDIQIAEIMHIQVTADEEKRALRKIDRTLMPVMAFCYMMQLLDKLALSYATQLGMLAQLKLHSTQYSWCSSIFYFGYMIWSWPSSYIAVRLPLGKYLSATVLVWGACVMCHSACTGFGGLMTVRFFLGVSEAAVAPGFSLLTGMFYKRKEQPLRHGVWFAGNCIANLLGGLIGYGVGQIRGSIESWKILFLLLGSITVAYSIPLLLVLPDSPSNAKFLNDTEKKIVLRRVLENQTGAMDEGKFRKHQMIEAFKDPQAWLLVLYSLTGNIPNGGITSFASLIIGGFGFGKLDSLLLQMPIGGIQLTGLAIVAVLATKFHSVRIPLMVLSSIVSLVGMILVKTLDRSNQYGLLVGIWLSAFAAVNYPLGLSLISSNIGGLTKKATVAAMLFIGYGLGNIVGPQFFLEKQAPKYETGIRSILACMGFNTFFLLCLYAYYIFENKRRDREFGPASGQTYENLDDLTDVTDRQIPGFRYTL